MHFEPIICFEVHAELKTDSKLFCKCPTGYGAEPNSQTCPVCTGQPGALPVLNKKAVEYCVRAGLALNCEINTYSRFARKNYFYPDLPKGYQISQYELPFCENGYLEITGDDGNPYAVGIKRIHLEEDAGKLVHSSSSFETATYSLVDYNRSSVPLLEIVADHTRNPLRSVQEARNYLEKLRQILRYIDVSDCEIEKGQFRCDVNVSIRPEGSEGFGNRAEIKNMASFRFVTAALEYEIKRQTDLHVSGEPILQETRLFDEIKKHTFPMRSKEDAPDYRYFPDPDLLEVELDQFFIQNIKEGMPELPDTKVNRITAAYGISREDALILTREKPVSDYFETAAASCTDKNRLSRWMLKDLFKLLNDASISIEECIVKPRFFAKLVNNMTNGQITERIGRSVLEEMFNTGKDPEIIIKEKSLESIDDIGVLEKTSDEVIAENPDIVEKIKSGQREPINFLIGQVMKKTEGKANTKKVVQILNAKLSSDKQ